MNTAATLPRVPRTARISQEGVVFLLTVLISALAAATLPGFLTVNNFANLLLNVSLLGILAIGMALVVIGRGLDLSLVGIMAISAAWTLQLLNQNLHPAAALGAAFLLALALGALNGFLIAFLEIPALFATLASSLAFVGFGRYALVPAAIVYLPSKDQWFLSIAQSTLLKLPLPIWIFVGMVAATQLVLKYTVFGRYLYAMGDNDEAARISGVPVRPMKVTNYAVASVFAFIGGCVIAASTGQVDIQIVNGTQIFDVILVVVLGGISLVGGRGSMVSLVAGTLLIAVILNVMLLMDVNSTIQNIAKGLVLLASILLDRILHPTDEETAKQGDTL
jgi:ribose transport system permease protein